MTRSLGQWNAYVEKGSTKDAQIERLNEVPDNLRKDVIKHMRTVVKLTKKKAEK